MERKIVAKAFSEKVINTKPLTVEIVPLITWLAEAVELPDLIIRSFKKFRAVKDKDYIMSIEA